MSLRKSLALGVSAVALSLGLAVSAQATTVLPVTNLTFNSLTNPLGQPKNFFTTVKPIGWSIGAAAQIDNLIYVGQQGSESYENQSSGNIYGVYSNPGFSNTVPAGTNFYQADGNPQFESTIMQTIPNLTAGTTYTLQFQQAAGQQGYPTGFSGATTEEWKVFLGVGGIGVNCSGNPCTVTGTTNNQEMDSTPMSNGSMMNVDWNNVTLSFTPTAGDLGGGSTGSAVLTFLAWGDNGSTTNLPPTVFLEGVNTPPVVPEPATLSLLGVGLLGLGALGLRRRDKNTAAA
jgi:PEP-CTERM motif